MQPVYLDYNATTPVVPEVMDAMIPYFRDHFGNPSSSHAYGRAAREGVDLARQQVANLLGADPQEVIFTGCATESNNIALFGLARAAAPNRRHFITSAIEHPSVMQPCLRLQREGWDMTVLSVDACGKIDVDELQRNARADTAFVSIMHANNEIGTIQPIQEIAEVTHARNIPLHVDAAQSVGKLHFNVKDLGADLVTIAGHKFYAPKGVGALYIRKGTALRPLTYGADHEFGMRPGTENVALTVGLGAACRLAMEKRDCIASHLAGLRDQLHSGLAESIPGLILNGHPTARLPNTLNVSFPAVAARELLETLEADVAASLGSACHSSEHAVSGVLAAIRAAGERAMGAVRFSVGLPTTRGDIARASQAIVAGWERLQRR
jgi:cysteine desulfurase